MNNKKNNNAPFYGVNNNNNYNKNKNQIISKTRTRTGVLFYI